MRPNLPAWWELSSLAGIDDATLRSRARRRRFARGETVFHEGDPSGSLHLVDRGRFAIRLTTPLGEIATVEVMQPGDCFGELALVEPNTERSATVVALERAETLSLDRGTFDQLRREHPGLDRFLLMVVSARLRATNQQLLEALYIAADVRVFRCLCRLGEIFAADDRVCIPLTQNDIGAMTGVTRSTVSRMLKQAQTVGAVAVTRSRIDLLDLSHVRRRAHLGRPATTNPS